VNGVRGTDAGDATSPTPSLPRLTDRSAVRVVGREACILGGAGAAILLQVAHPAVGRGVAEHSRFADDPLARLRGTLTYVYGLTFGTPEEIARVAALVSRVHAGVVGPGYSANDPELQLWVAGTLYQAAAQSYEIAFGRMPPAMKEEFCRQSARAAIALGCPAELWPGSVAGFDAYWRRQLAGLEVSDEARRICRDMMYSRNLPWFLRPVLPLSRLVTAGLLPDRLRAEYGFPWNRRREWLFRAAVRTTRLVYRHVPRSVRELPKTYYLRGFRRQVRGHPTGSGSAA
jgi:uncharacterized protein (DUF2236 family)